MEPGLMGLTEKGARLVAGRMRDGEKCSMRTLPRALSLVIEQTLGDGEMTKPIGGGNDRKTTLPKGSEGHPPPLSHPPPHRLRERGPPPDCLPHPA